MSDFLDNLAQRSLGLAETVQPRLPSLFEKAQPAAGSLFSPGFMVSEKRPQPLTEFSGEGDAEAPLAHRMSRVSAAGSPPARCQDDEFNQRESASMPAPESGTAPPEAALRITAASPLPVNARRSGVTFSTPGLPEEGSAARIAARAKPAAGTSASGTDLHRGEPQATFAGGPRMAIVDSKPLPAIVSAAIEPAAIAPVAIGSQRDERMANSYPSAELPALLRRFVEAQAAQRLPAEGLRPAPASEATIHVTIGRIEVRATPQSAPARQRLSTSPVTTLEEYLRSRSQRGGR